MRRGNSGLAALLLAAGVAFTVFTASTAWAAACTRPVYLSFDTGHMGVAPLVAEVLKRHPELLRVRLVVAGEMANDRMSLRVETTSTTEGLPAAVAASVRDVTKLRCDVELLAPGSLPNDGRLIEDSRTYD